MADERLKEPNFPPSFEEVMNRTRQSFTTRKTLDPTLPTHPLHGRVREGYTFSDAAYDTVDTLVSEGVDVDELFIRMKKETTTSPLRTDWGPLADTETWDNVVQYLVKEIILKEMPIRYPDLIVEEQRRLSLYKIMPPPRRAIQ